MNIVIFFGGVSPEHEVSVVSSQTVVKYLDKEKYTPYLIGISKSGQWYSFTLEDFYLLRSVEDQPSSPQITLQFSKNPVLIIGNTTIHVDCAFPVLHGKGGEDGSIQGLLESFSIPYVGCGVESSAICMNKILTKILLEHAQIKVSPYKVLSKQEFLQGHFSPQKIIDDFDLPLFIKEPHGGSSVGVTKIHRPDQFYPTLQELFQHEQYALIEQTMKGREIECSILTQVQDHSLQWIASLPGEIVPQREFYDYIAKYIEDTTRLDVPADLPKELIKKIQSISIKAAKTVSCYGMARVDCFLIDNNNIVVNEINTIPGFTSISMYPSLWKVSGIETSQLIDNLIQTALYRKESQP